jgi:Protein of unknown function (DUF229)
MVESISRHRSLVKKTKLLERLNFTSFSHYTTVANDDASNQAALYSGTAHVGSKPREWLWDTLRSHGYATLKAADACVDPHSQSIPSDSVDHGKAFRQMMCFDFQRPNCLGQKSAAQHLMDYGTQFMRAYDELEQPCAVFLHFIDAKEDSQTMEDTLDDPC